MPWVLFAFTAPWAAFSWLVGVLSVVVGLTEPSSVRFEGAAILTLEWRGWVSDIWPYSTTLGRTIWYRPSHRDPAEPMDEPLERHERVHIRQVEDRMLLSFIVGVVVAIATRDWILGLILWSSGGVWQLPNFLTAMMRFGLRNAYRDSEHERSAYAQTSLWPNGESWWDRRERIRVDPP